MNLPYADKVSYWKTSQSTPDTWIERTKKVIKEYGGSILGEAFGSDSNGHAAFMIAFKMQDENFKIIWPVLPVRKTKDQTAARVQAATLLYHDVKARCISATVLGARTAFFNYLMLEDGRTAAQLASPELIEVIPQFLLSST